MIGNGFRRLRSEISPVIIVDVGGMSAEGAILEHMARLQHSFPFGQFIPHGLTA